MQYKFQVILLEFELFELENLLGFNQSFFLPALRWELGRIQRHTEPTPLRLSLDMGSAISSQKKGCAAARLRQEELADVEEHEGLVQRVGVTTVEDGPATWRRTGGSRSRYALLQEVPIQNLAPQHQQRMAGHARGAARRQPRRDLRPADLRLEPVSPLATSPSAERSPAFKTTPVSPKQHSRSPIRRLRPAGRESPLRHQHPSCFRASTTASCGSLNTTCAAERDAVGGVDMSFENVSPQSSPAGKSSKECAISISKCEQEYGLKALEGEAGPIAPFQLVSGRIAERQ